MPPRRQRPRPGAPEQPRLPVELGEGVHVDVDAVGDVADAHLVGIDGEDLDDLALTRCVVEGVRLTARSARRARLTDVVLRDCELSGLDLQEAVLVRVRIERCRAEGLDAGLLRAADVAVVDTKLTDAGLRMTRWERATIEGCDLRRAELLEAELTHVVVEGCDLTGADLTRARMDEVRFRSSQLDDLKGASALSGSLIERTQVVSVAMSLLVELGIGVEDGELADLPATR